MAENETAHDDSSAWEIDAFAGATPRKYSIPFCPIRNGDCHPRCMFATSAVGCEVRSALLHFQGIRGHLEQIASDITNLTSEPETVLDAATETM